MQKGYRYQIPVQEPPNNPPEPIRQHRRLISGAIILFALLLISALLLRSRASSENAGAQAQPTDNQIFVEDGGRITLDPQSPTPTPFQFQELTIPYLRSREYKSRLGEQTVNYRSATYTAYDTRYDSDGLRINGLLTIPNGQAPGGGWPAIVFVHGYIPPAQYGNQYYDYVDYLAGNGYVVFKIDLRGHAQSEGEPGGAYYSSDYIIDTLNARAALQSADFVNPDKVGLWGHSMAGNVTLRSLVTRPEIPAVAIWGGAVFTYADRLQYGIQDGSYVPPAQTTNRQRQRQRLRDAYGEFDRDHWFWKQVTPINYLNDVKGAISLHHAVNDDVVNIGYSRGLNDILNATKIPHKLNEYPSGGHNISGASFVQAMQDTVAFYDRHLK